MVRVFTQLSQPIVRLALVVDPEIGGTARARTDRVVVRVMLSAFADDVSFNRILGRQRIKDANTVTTVPSNVIHLNDVYDYGSAARGYSGLKPDSILIVLKDFIFLDQIVGRAVLQANSEFRVPFTSIVPDCHSSRGSDDDPLDVREDVVVFDHTSVRRHHISQADWVLVRVIAEQDVAKARGHYLKSGLAV
jgi:hypothetical protein